jgi:hypothetical protein
MMAVLMLLMTVVLFAAVRGVKAVPQIRRLFAIFPPQRPGFEPGSSHVRFVVDKVEVTQVFFPSTSVSPANSHSTDCSTLIIYHLELVQ